mgnify:CR=1 FL=1
MAGKLRPLWTPGGARSQSPARALAPSLVTPPLANSVGWFEDFFATAIAPVAYASGLIATPDTLTNVTPYGQPSWIGTEVVGTTSSIAPSSSSTAGFAGCGVVQIGCGPNIGDTMAMEAGSSLGAYGSVNANEMLAQFRVGFVTASGASSNAGFGLLSSTTAIGTDWITDPDTTLNATAALVFTRHAASYSGDAAGDLVARLYDTAGVYNNSAVLLASASILANGPIKIEALLSFSLLSCFIFVNGTLRATFPLTGIAAVKSARRVFIMQVVAATTRIMLIDSYFQEVARPAAR